MLTLHVTHKETVLYNIQKQVFNIQKKTSHLNETLLDVTFDPNTGILSHTETGSDSSFLNEIADIGKNLNLSVDNFEMI